MAHNYDWKVLTPVAKVNELPTGPETIYKQARNNPVNYTNGVSSTFNLREGGRERSLSAAVINVKANFGDRPCFYKTQYRKHRFPRFGR